jgi:hypothetical protein
VKHLSSCDTVQRVPLVLRSKRCPEDAQPSIIWVPKFLLGIKWPGREVDHSPLSGGEVKNEWSYNSTPPYAFMVRTGTTCFLSHTIDKMKNIVPENSTNLSAQTAGGRSNFLLLSSTKTTVWNEITHVIGKSTFNDAGKMIFYSRRLFKTNASYKSKICVYQIIRILYYSYNFTKYYLTL